MEELLKKKEFYTENKDKLNKIIKEKFEKAFAVEFTHNSTAIEGNTLSLIEVKVLIDDNISIGGKDLKEIFEVVNHNKAFNYIKKAISNNEELDENKVKDIHEILMGNIIKGGIYRNLDVRIVGATHYPPSPNEMYNQMKFFYEDLKLNKNKMNEIELAAWVHAEFVRIHPFSDGNGRMSRLIMNYQLMLSGYLPIDIKKEDRIKYYDLLDEYGSNGNLEPFYKYILELENKRLDEINEVIKQSIELS